MPEMRFQIAWPNGEQQICYSPSLVMKEHLEVGGELRHRGLCRALPDGAGDRERVRAKYGFPCSLAQAEVSRIAHQAARFQGHPGKKVRVLKFIE